MYNFFFFIFSVLELPGHRIFRRKWSDFFRYTAVVVFIIDLSELCDSAFYTGHLKNKTVSIYENLVKNDLLSNVGFILLFNKKDTFDDMARGFDFKPLSANVSLSFCSFLLISCIIVQHSCRIQ
ncbi:unnamed protein product [Angiostrongylus costaricensis]|uniref:G protein alpha subunit n=1 Tax=Angiostrongylus costaricensis TaxID=334426 RepID=A0A0R3PC59_ANGCS|nr:unnamed protein product [Angiostrongylus costaricensis]